LVPLGTGNGAKLVLVELETSSVPKLPVEAETETVILVLALAISHMKGIVKVQVPDLPDRTTLLVSDAELKKELSDDPMSAEQLIVWSGGIDGSIRTVTVTTIVPVRVIGEEVGTKTARAVNVPVVGSR
jgi:hypothetical protein